MRKLLKHLVQAALIAVLLAPTVGAHAATDVVASIPELAALAREVGGNRVSVYSVAQPNQDYHQVDARPSDVARISRADLFVRVGMDFDLWADALLSSARNHKVSKGGPGYVDASEHVRRIEVPVGQINGASGDIHVWGNPHYYYDPGYGKVAAHNILEGLNRVDPRNSAYYNANYTRFIERIDAAISRWRQELAPCRGTRVVTYHKNYDYFMTRFGIEGFNTLEPKPGIPPSPAHISHLIQAMRKDHVKAMVIASVYGHRYPELVARETGARLSYAPYSVGVMGTRDYIDFIDRIVAAFRDACR